MSDTELHNVSDLIRLDLPEPQQIELRELLATCHQYMEHCDDDLIERAFKLAYYSHDGETRASGEPYYLHPIEVANIVIKELGMDDVSVAVALLHDTVEDTNVNLEHITKEFGPIVAMLIDGLTKISGVFNSKGAKQAETFMKLLLSMAEDLRVVLIKFADRLHNMRTIHHLPRRKQISIAAETTELYAPLAHRFGLYSMKSEFEDLCFKVMDPTGFKFVARKLREKKESREDFIGRFMEPIEKQLKDSGFEFEIKGRPKHIFSIYRKMMRQQKPFEEIYDLFAIRIILENPHSKEDCWRVYSFITDAYTPIPARFRDFISVPKANGYQSLHTTVITNTGRKVEVQIRTRKMDEIAEKGLAAHWKYKEGNEMSSMDKFVNWVREVLDNPRPDAATEFMEDFQLNLYSDEIYAFTPNGELRTLPKGSTPIDFAFDIHSEIGERALAAKVNGQMVPLRHKLKSGDQVEIITGKQINLNPDWINDVKTHKARSRIRQFIKQKERVTSDAGREVWNKKIQKSKITITDQELAKVATKLRFSSLQKMFYEIGSGAFDVTKLYKAVKSFKGSGRLEQEANPDLKPIDEKQIYEIYFDDARDLKDNRKGLLINGQLTDVKYVYAKCCNPIPGDDVVGFISREGDLKIHRVNCNNTKHLARTDGERIIDVKWAKRPGGQFVGAVKIIGEDRVGMINDITNLISKSLKTNMKSVNVNSDSGMFEGTLILLVEDIKHLENVIQKLQNIEGVKLAYRYE